MRCRGREGCCEAAKLSRETTTQLEEERHYLPLTRHHLRLRRRRCRVAAGGCPVRSTGGGLAGSLPRRRRCGRRRACRASEALLPLQYFLSVYYFGSTHAQLRPPSARCCRQHTGCIGCCQRNNSFPPPWFSFTPRMAIGFHSILSPPQPPHSLPRLQTLWQQPARGLGSGRDSCGSVSFQCVSKRTPYLVQV